LKSFSNKISNTKEEDIIKGIIKYEINNLKIQIPEASHHIIQNLDSINNLCGYELDVYKKLLITKYKKTNYNIYTALCSGGRSTRCWVVGRMTSYIKKKK